MPETPNYWEYLRSVPGAAQQALQESLYDPIQGVYNEEAQRVSEEGLGALEPQLPTAEQLQALQGKLDPLGLAGGFGADEQPVAPEIALGQQQAFVGPQSPFQLEPPQAPPGVAPVGLPKVGISLKGLDASQAFSEDDLKPYKDAAVAMRKSKEEIATIQDDITSQYNMATAEAAATEQRLKERQDDMRLSAEEGKKALEEASLLSTYANGPTARVKELGAVVGDPEASPEEKAKAQTELDRYGQLDPRRALGGVGTQVLAAISIGLGAYGAAMTGGPNYAMQIIDKAIERDIVAQKDRFRNKRSAFFQEKDIYARKMGALKDEQAAELATAGYMSQNTALMLRGMAQKVGDVQKKAMLEDTALRYETKALEFEKSGEQLTIDNLFKKKSLQLKGQALGLQRGVAAAQMRAGTQEGRVTEKTLPPGVTVLPGKIVTEKDVTTIKTTLDDGEKLLSRFKELKRLRAQYGAEKVKWADGYQEINQVFKDIKMITKGKAFYNLGAALTAVEDILQEGALGGDPTRLIGPVERLIQKSEDFFTKDLHTILRNRNVKYEGFGGGGRPATESAPVKRGAR